MDSPLARGTTTPPRSGCSTLVREINGAFHKGTSHYDENEINHPYLTCNYKEPMFMMIQCMISSSSTSNVSKERAQANQKSLGPCYTTTRIFRYLRSFLDIKVPWWSIRNSFLVNATVCLPSGNVIMSYPRSLFDCWLALHIFRTASTDLLRSA